MFFGRSEAKDDKVKKVMELSRELHDLFKKNHKVTCCRVLIKKFAPDSPDKKAQCAQFSAEVTEETARIILREMGQSALKP
jgi:C_GCAxxG_C_C family probable redox protein